MGHFTIKYNKEDDDYSIIFGDEFLLASYSLDDIEDKFEELTLHPDRVDKIRLVFADYLLRTMDDEDSPVFIQRMFLTDLLKPVTIKKSVDGRSRAVYNRG